MIKLIATDMDGTLFNSNQEISPLNIAAIKQAEKQNVEFMIATGRSMDTIGNIVKVQRSGIKTRILSIRSI